MVPTWCSHGAVMVPSWCREPKLSEAEAADPCFYGSVRYEIRPVVG